MKNQFKQKINEIIDKHIREPRLRLFDYLWDNENVEERAINSDITLTYYDGFYLYKGKKTLVKAEVFDCNIDDYKQKDYKLNKDIVQWLLAVKDEYQTIIFIGFFNDGEVIWDLKNKTYAEVEYSFGKAYLLNLYNAKKVNKKTPVIELLNTEVNGDPRFKEAEIEGRNRLIFASEKIFGMDGSLDFMSYEYESYDAVFKPKDSTKNELLIEVKKRNSTVDKFFDDGYYLEVYKYNKIQKHITNEKQKMWYINFFEDGIVVWQCENSWIKEKPIVVRKMNKNTVLSTEVKVDKDVYLLYRNESLQIIK